MCIRDSLHAHAGDFAQDIDRHAAGGCNDGVPLGAPDVGRGDAVSYTHLDVYKRQLHGHEAHAGLGVTVSSRGVAVHRTKVTLTIHQRVAQGAVSYTHLKMFRDWVATVRAETSNTQGSCSAAILYMLGIISSRP